MNSENFFELFKNYSILGMMHSLRILRFAIKIKKTNFFWPANQQLSKTISIESKKNSSALFCFQNLLKVILQLKNKNARNSNSPLNFKFVPKTFHLCETSAYYGVSWLKREQKWKAQRSGSRGNWHFGGLFSDELEAAKKSDELARKHLGVVATLNFPTKSEKKTLRKNKVLFVAELPSNF